MEKFNPNKINIYSINNGYRYENRQGISAEAINAPIEASAYAQGVAEKALSVSDEAKQIALGLEQTGGTLPPITAYPIGSVFRSANDNYDPNALFGGTWERSLNYGAYHVIGSVVKNVTNTSAPFLLFTHDEIREMFNSKYGADIANQFSLENCFASAVNGDIVAQPNAISVIGWGTDGLYIDVSKSTTGGARVNYIFAINATNFDGEAKWVRIE